jgi:hypothetical protein
MPVKSNVLERNSFLADSSSLSPSSFCTTGTMASRPWGIGREASMPVRRDDEAVGRVVADVEDKRRRLGLLEGEAVDQGAQRRHAAELEALRVDPHVEQASPGSS